MLVVLACKSRPFERASPSINSLYSTPMYQVLQHALADPGNKTRFTLIFANVTPKDILLKEEFDALKAKHPETLKIVYTVDKPDAEWKGAYAIVARAYKN